ncbi:MAG TPA: thioredoxin domain-containing protein, partial [Acidobacteriota bacterium]|nr:thioredoxin domain-containing protein [Acidobacteriota bacterium]
MADGKPANRLLREKSPYLRQHAYNPVDWYPWGEEAFERARREDKPVFLSIGYSTCHWCHVMERESFDDEEAARLLNEAFVCVKVDREERPDLDRYYMAAGQMLAGAGGWPLTIVMTPDKRPFFAGTYVPKDRRWGRPGLTELVPRISEAWRTRREELLRSAGRVTDLLVKAERGPESGTKREISPSILDRAFREFEADFDERHGGFGGAPKFPVPHNLAFLLRYWKRTGNERALAMVEKTLERMRLGGLWDHLGGGFHRYSTDDRWLVPHFEKMLYDQALLAEAYAEAYAATGKDDFRRSAAATLDYVRRDLGAPEGGFYTAEDADSEGEEGRFYMWTKAEVGRALGPDEASLAIRLFDVGDAPSVLHLEKSPAEVAAELGIGPDRLPARLESVRRKLLNARAKRPRPFKDTKVLTDWNGLAIGALAKAARLTGEMRFVEAAEKAARFVLDRMRAPDGRLRHMFMEGEASIPAYLDDYAFLIRGLVEVYETGFDPHYLEGARDLVRIAAADFGDAEGGGFLTVAGTTELPVRSKEVYDGAVPSGNSVMLMNLLRLSRLTGNADFEDAAARLTGALSDNVEARPRAHAAFLCGLDYAFGPAAEVVVVGDAGDRRTDALLTALGRAYLPNAVVLFKPGGRAARINALAPFARDMTDAAGP